MSVKYYSQASMGNVVVDAYSDDISIPLCEFDLLGSRITPELGQETPVRLPNE